METIRVGQVEVENFFSVKSLAVDYEDQGLILIEGANGSGKSSIFVEALCYGLFGVSMRDVSKDEVVNRFVGSDCRITIPLRVGEDEVRIDTYRKHRKYKDSVMFSVNGQTKGFTGNSSEQTRDNIIKYLDMDYTTFTNAVILGQTVSQYFSGLTDARQKEVVERLLGITWIPRAYEIAKEDAGEIRGRINELQAKLNLIEDSLDKLNSQLGDAVSKHNSFEEDRVERILKVREEISRLVSVQASKVKLIKEQEAKNEEIEKKIAEPVLLLGQIASREEVEAQLNQRMKLLGSLGTTQQIKADRVSEIKTKLKRASAIKVGSVCEFCGQKIVDLESYVAHLNQEWKDLGIEIDKLDAEITKVDQEKSVLLKQKLQFDEIEREKQGLQKELLKHKDILNQMKVDNAKISSQVEALDNEVNKIGKEVNTYQPLVDSLKKEVEVQKAKKSEFDSLKDSEKSELDYHAFWEEGFSNKGVKSLIIDSMIPQMNRWASIYARALGGKFDVSFSTQKAIKSGELREKFYVKPENRLGATSYNGNSGGEKRVIDSIVMFVLGDLAASRSSKRFSILILDEVFERLDEGICDSIIRVLKAMVTDPAVRDDEFADLPSRESIFVLTHLDYFKSKFSNKFKVTRNGDGYTILE